MRPRSCRHGPVGSALNGRFGVIEVQAPAFGIAGDPLDRFLVWQRIQLHVPRDPTPLDGLAVQSGRLRA
jgi:hypothetical protein